MAIVHTDTGRSTAVAAARGAVGAMSMSAARTVTSELGLVEQTPPDAVLREGAPGLLRRVPPDRQRAVVELLHWAYGTAGGLVYGLLPARLRRSRWSGPAYGLLLWAGFEAVLAPMLGLARSEHRRPVERLALAADHVLYGLMLPR